MMGAYGFARGPYSDHLALFVEFKRGKGEKGGHGLLATLRKISLQLSCEREASGLDERRVRSLLERLDGESDASREYRVSVMRQLCSFLDALGVPCWQVPPRYFRAAKADFRPYIFSDSDVAALLSAADSLPPSTGRAKGYERIYPVLVRLLLSTGLRISEALALATDDFDAGLGTLVVTNSKNGVSRTVPLSAGMADVLARHVSSGSLAGGPVFPSPYTGRAYSYDAVQYMFGRLYEGAGIRTESGRLPRIHDCRHWFCTRSLDKMLASGMGVYEAVPILAAYVGHVNYTDTEKYVHLTRAGHRSFVESESALGAMIPRVVS